MLFVFLLFFKYFGREQVVYLPFLNFWKFIAPFFCFHEIIFSSKFSGFLCNKNKKNEDNMHCNLCSGQFSMVTRKSYAKWLWVFFSWSNLAWTISAQNEFSILNFSRRHFLGNLQCTLLSHRNPWLTQRLVIAETFLHIQNSSSHFWKKNQRAIRHRCLSLNLFCRIKGSAFYWHLPSRNLCSPLLSLPRSILADKLKGLND